MKYTIDKQENYSIFTLDEENLNSVIAPSLKSQLVILRNEGINNLIFNLSCVKYVDSSGLSAILTANRLWLPNGNFVLTGIVHPSVKKLIEISRLQTVITIKETVDASVQFIRIAQTEAELEAELEDAESDSDND
jgi:anti-sigma B factor antagonist